MSESPVLGIDLGTTNSVVAVADQERVHVFADEEGACLTPSTVSFHPSGQVLVGMPAVERRLVDAANTVASVKRLIGRPFRSPEVKRAAERLPFVLEEAPGGGVSVKIRGERYTLPEISAFVLRRLKAVAEQTLHMGCERAVVTVPANFNELQRTATRDAGRIAGLQVMRILNEPTAAALAYGYGARAGRRIAVYDLGGGTFDVSILDMSGDVIEVIATAGDTYLGGDDVDNAIAAVMVDAFLRQHRIDAREDPQAHERLRMAAEWLKCELSDQAAAHATLEQLAFDGAGRPIDFTFELSRRRLEEIAFPLIGRTFDICEEALKLAQLRPAQLDGVVLVGGQTRSPQVRRMVAEYFGRDPEVSLDPDQVVAQGAALQALALSGREMRTHWRMPIRPPETPDELAPPPSASRPPSVPDFSTTVPHTSPPPAAPAAPRGGRRPGSQAPVLSPAPVVSAPPSGSFFDGEVDSGDEGFEDEPTRVTAPPAPPAVKSLPVPPPAASLPSSPPAPRRGPTPRTLSGIGQGQSSTPPDGPTRTGSTLPPPAPRPGRPASTGAASASTGAASASTGAPAGAGGGRPPPPPPSSGTTDGDDDLSAPLPAALFGMEPDFESQPNSAGPSGPPASAPPMPPPAAAPPPTPPPLPEAGQPARDGGGADRTPAGAAGPDFEVDSLTPTAVMEVSRIEAQAFEQEAAQAPQPEVGQDPEPEAEAVTAPIPTTKAGPSLRSPPLLLDVTPRALAVETAGGFCEAIVPRNSPIPTEQTRLFSTSQDGQVRVSMRISQGEARRTEDNEVLGELELVGLREAARGKVQIQVTFVLDADGMLRARARDEQTGKSQEVRINLVGALSDDEIERLKLRQDSAYG